MCITTTPDDLCITLQGIPDPENGVNKTYHLPQEGPCFWQTFAPHIGALFARIEEFGREEVMFFCSAGPVMDPVYTWRFELHEQPADCWTTRVLTCDQCPFPAPDPAWDSIAVWHTSQWCPPLLGAL